MGLRRGFLHGVNLDDWYPCHNLEIAGRLWTPDFLALVEPEFKFAPIDEFSIAELRAGKGQAPLTPRSMWTVWASGIIREGGHVGIGQENTIWLSREQEVEILRLGDAELDFEEARREYSPKAVSRLSCIWLAENSAAGKEHILNMLHRSGTRVHVLRVKVIAKLGLTRVDTAWFDRYLSHPKDQYIAEYWNGVPGSTHPTWEYLLNGAIRAADSGEVETIRAEGAHRRDPGSEKFWQQFDDRSVQAGQNVIGMGLERAMYPIIKLKYQKARKERF